MSQTIALLYIVVFMYIKRSLLVFCSVECPFNTTCDDKTSTTHFLVSIWSNLSFFFFFFSTLGNFLTEEIPLIVRNLKIFPNVVFDSTVLEKIRKNCLKIVKKAFFGKNG